MKKIKSTVSPYSRTIGGTIPSCVIKFFIKSSKEEVEDIGNASIIFLLIHNHEGEGIDMDSKEEVGKAASDLGVSTEYFIDIVEFLKSNSILFEEPKEISNCSMEDLMDKHHRYLEIESVMVEKLLKKIEASL